MITQEELDFLRESNNIEGEYDDKSLQDAILAWVWLKDKQKLYIEDIKEIHRILMASRDTLEEKDKGEFRNGPVWIGGKEAKKAFAIPVLIDEWLEKVNRGLKLQDGKEYFCQQMHVQFESIHPFFDGNGRTGRLLYNWQRFQLGLPIHVIKESEKHEYYKWFK